MIPVPGRPFGAVTTSNGAWSFISVDNSIAVFSDRPHVSSRFHSIQVPGQPLGEALTHDGRDLLVADESGVAVISAQAAERGSPNAVAGMLTSPAGASGGAIEALGSLDNRYVFVTLEGNNDLAVFNLGKARANGFGPSDFVGTVPLGLAPVGMAMSPNGEWLYATSEVQRGRSATRECPITHWPNGRRRRRRSGARCCPTRCGSTSSIGGRSGTWSRGRRPTTAW